MKPYLPQIITNGIFIAMGVSLYLFKSWDLFYWLWIIGVCVNLYFLFKNDR